MKHLYIFLFLLLSVSMTAQDAITYQRIYPLSGRSLLNSSLAVTSDDGFYLGSVFLDVGNEVTVHLTQHSAKGDVNWAKDISIDSEDGQLTFDMDIIAVEGDAAILSVTGVNAIGIIQNRLLVNFSVQGDVLWSNTIIQNEGDRSFLGQVKMVSSFSDGVVYGGSNSNDSSNNTSAFLADYNLDGTTNWGKIYTPLDDETGEEKTAVYTGIDRSITDSTYVLTGLLDTITDNAMFVSKVDTVGNVVWSKTLLHDQPGIQNQPLDVAVSLDSTIAVVGLLLDPVQGTPFTYVTKLDRNGNPLWNYNISFGGLFPLTIGTQILMDNDGSVITSGRFIDVYSGDLFDYLLKLDPAGNLIWASSFPEVDSYVIDQAIGVLIGGDLRKTSDGYLLSNTAIDLVSQDLYPFVIRSDFDGTSTCQSAVDVLQDTLELRVQDLSLFVSDYLVTDTIEVDDMVFNEYDLPLVSLLDTMFCPQDPIEVTLDAFNDEASTYSWSTGETTSEITVFEEGMYSVTVTFDTLTCFQLCDTANISKVEFPMAGLFPDYTTYCLDGEFTLSATTQDGLPPFEYLWQDGTTEPFIQSDVFGDYAVTITDACDNTGSASMLIMESEIPIGLNPTLAIDSSEICSTGEVIIFVENSSQYSSFQWSNGESGVDFIQVSEIGNYSVNAIDFCDRDVSSSKELTEGLLPRAIEFGNIFFPRSTFDQNKTFGPFVRCPELVSDYELRVFNRWGKKVFETDNISREWNGADMGSGKLLQGDVYMYYARYTDDMGEDHLLEGNVTMVR